MRNRLLPQNLLSEYLAERTRFMRHRRAAEMVAIVFGDQLRAAGDAEYEKFDCQNERPLVRLGAYRTTAIEPEYKGPGLSAPVEVPAQAFVPLLGFCSTPGCDKPHDAYCDPCGHAVCCWACLGAQRTCPVCNVVITDRSLCYPANTLELEATRQEETQKGMGVGSSVAPVAKKYMLTHHELSAKKQQNKQVVQCMAQGCNAQLVSGQKHHCRCCGIKVCAQTRQALSPPHSFLHTKLMSRRAAGVHRVLLPEEETPHRVGCGRRSGHRRTHPTQVRRPVENQLVTRRASCESHRGPSSAV